MSSIPQAKITLTYPVYAADFDPRNNAFLLVGGGGGEGRSGVGNKITLLNASKGSELSEIVDLDLSKKEDSVTSLAIARSTESSLIAYAGINSSEQDQASGTNEHLRSFRLEYPPRKIDSEKDAAYSGKTEAISKTSLFRTSTARKKETYQRVLRLTRWREDQQQRIAAIATGLAPESEIVVFRVETAPSETDELGRISLGAFEAADLDFGPIEGDGNQLLAYCTDYAVYTYKISNTSPSANITPTLVHDLPSSPSKTSPRPKFRSLRFLTPRNILLLRNRPQKSGADLLIFRLAESAELGAITLEKRLNTRIKAAVGLDVCVLPSSRAGEYQIVVAVASQDTSIEILSLDYSPVNGLSAFKAYTVFRATHPASITSLRFSNFIPPQSTSSADRKVQAIKLASTSVSQTVVVHTLPLRMHLTTSPENSRYVLVPPGPSDALQTTFSALVAIFVVGIAIFFLQAFSEIRGAVPSTLGATEWLHPRLKEMVAQPYMFSPEVDPSSLPSIIPTAAVEAAESATSLLSDFLFPSSSSSASPNADIAKPDTKAIIVRSDAETGISAQLHPEGHPDQATIEKENLQRFEDLTSEQREGWKTRLREAGHWAEEQGETILKGVFFGELGGLVGEIVRGA